MSSSYPSWLAQPATPPYDPFPVNDNFHVRNVSNSSTSTYESGPIHVQPISTSESAPFGEYVQPSLPTPVKSPIRQHGPLLLPKIRLQDQDFDLSPSPKKHRKTLSCTYKSPTSSLVYADSTMARRRSMSPARVCDLISPSSGPSRSTRAPSLVSSPGSTSSSTQHSRRASAPQLDHQMLEKYGFPTYRQLPTYIAPPTFAASMVPGASTFVPPMPVYTPSVQPVQSTIPLDLQYDPMTPTTTMLTSLRAPNPSPALVRQINMASGRGTGQTHFWWDIRNLRSWSDFSLETIDQIPGLMRLLTVELPQTALPCPQIERSKLQPETEGSLHELCRDFYAVKINAALKVAQGASHMTMRSQGKGSGPQFVSNYQNDGEKTIAGDGRARVVGLVKSFDRWNTGMRAEAPHRKVEYLLGLSHLHRYMREHGCRYGFIMTEIELVCVRAGTQDTPYFGFVELAPTIRLNATEGLTACLALWYLHMLAKEVPLPGQPGWKLDIGGAAACTRQKNLEKDSWIPAPQLAEKREAKRTRGYVFCTDPLHRRELPRAGRRLSHR